jgi:hypothetical protein
MSPNSDSVTSVDVTGVTPDQTLDAPAQGAAGTAAPSVRRLCSPTRSHFLVGGCRAGAGTS